MPWRVLAGWRGPRVSAHPVSADHNPYPCVLEDGTSIEISGLNEPEVDHLYYGATIGENWSALPGKQAVNWLIDGSPRYALDISGDVYLTDIQGQPVGLLRDQAWYDEGITFSAFPLSPAACCYYTDCPDAGSWGHSWNNPGRNQDCAAPCPNPVWGLEQYENFNVGEGLSTAPGGKLADGVLRLLDGHGGATAQHVLLLEAIRSGYPLPSDHTHIHLLFAYVAPGQYRDENTQEPVDRFPVDTFLLSLNLIDLNFGIPVMAKAVHHVSADIAGASPGWVDAGDLAAISSAWSNCASYCTDTGCQPDGSPPFCTWRHDLNGNGWIDAPYLSIWASQVSPNPAHHCALTKADPDDSLDRILDWFGMIRTGRSIVQFGQETPEIAVIDEARMQVAIANPYGYRTGPMVIEEQSLSRVKTLYR
jgi:hypothetical protein